MVISYMPAPQENHHVAAAFEVLSQPGTNFLAHLDHGMWARLRKLVIELVLATDVSPCMPYVLVLKEKWGCGLSP